MKPRPPAPRAPRARTLITLSALGLCACQTDPPATPKPGDASVAGVVSRGAEDAGGLLLAKGPPGDEPAKKGPAGVAAAEKPPLPPLAAEVAPPPTPRAADPRAADLLRSRVVSHFEGKGQKSRRLHVQTDKPLYKPGETIWLRLWDLKTRDLGGDHGSPGAMIELVSPRGATVLKRKVREQLSGAPADLPLAAGLPGGEYTLRVRTLDGQSTERPVIVSSYEAPRLQLKLEFLRKAYGAGDEVSATIAVRRATGEPLRDHALKGLVRLDGLDLPEVRLTTDESGEGIVRFTLPERIDVGDGLLTVLADDGGLTESIAKRVPIIVNHLALSTFPEGGHLVEGLPGRVYFEAKNPLGKPADVTGRVVDDRGAVVARLSSVRDGLGRVDLTPAPGRSYHIEIEQPAGIADQYPLPPALNEGCVLRSFDDLDGQQAALRVAVRCSAPQRVVVSAMLRENLLDAAAVDVPGGAPAVVYLQPDAAGAQALARAQGAARVTVFDEALNPLAERLIYRNRRARLGVSITAARKEYAPREQVELDVTTTDPGGVPVAAEVALSVVDDTVLTFADDKTGHMLSRIYLEPELPGKVEEPNFYFDLAEDKSALAMDLLMGTRGYRRFEWRPVLNTPPRPLLLAHNARPTTATPGQDFGGLRKAQRPALDAEAQPDGKPLELAQAEKAPKAAGAKKATARFDRDEGALALGDDPKRGKATGEAPVDRDARNAAAVDRQPMAEPTLAKADPREPVKEMKRERAEVATQLQAAPAAVRHHAPMPTAPATPPREAPLAAATRAADKTPAPEGRAAPMRPAKAKAAMPMGGAPAKDDLADIAGGVLAQGQLGHLGNKGAGAGFAGGEMAAGPRRRAAMGDEDLMIGGGVGRMPRLQIARPRPPQVTWAPVRVFPLPAYQPDYAGPRSDFRETVFFAPSVRTDGSGHGRVSFPLSDAITAFRVVGEGAGAGAVGRGAAVIKSSLPFSMVVKIPQEVSEGDHLELPLQLTNERERPLNVDLLASFGDLLKLDRPVTRTAGTLAAGAREALFYPLTVTGKRGRSTLTFTASASGLRDEFTRQINVSPRGFPQHVARSGQLADRFVADLDLGDVLPGTSEGKLQLFPSPVSSMIAGLEGLLVEPNGCFEQASSTNYPNVMILRYLKTQRRADAALLGKTSLLLESGYKKLTGYETPRRGYEWFGAAPAHEALSAYGLMQFVDMQTVYPEVDREMIRRTASWLRGRRDGQGGYQKDGKALDTFGRASKEVTDAYITYSLTEAHQSDLDAELSVSERLGRDSSDGYLLALAANSLLNAGRRDAGQAAVKRLLTLQDESGGFLKASHSITRSGGVSLQVETTALALLALLKSDAAESEGTRRAVEWLISHRGGYGQWGATQSTVLALKALTAYAVHSRRTEAPGDVTLVLNGQRVASQHYEAGRRAPLAFVGWEQHLRPGKNHVELVHEGKTPLPFSLGIDYRALRPATSPKAQVELITALEKAQVALGESVRLNVVARSRSDEGLPMTLVRVGLPGGLSFQTWQLKELRDKGLIAFYETGPREVNLYLRDMKPRQEVRLPLDLLATTPGRYTGPASRAYLYYTSEHKSWVDGVSVNITP